MTFDEWFNEIEGFHLRCERFYDDAEAYKYRCEPGDVRVLLGWLKAAYEVGYDHAMSKLVDDGK